MNSEFTIHDLPRATSESAGFNLAVTQDIILSSWEGVTLICMLVKGPLPSRTFGLIIGRSSNYRKNFEVIPGVIDEDSLAEIKTLKRDCSTT